MLPKSAQSFQHESILYSDLHYVSTDGAPTAARMMRTQPGSTHCSGVGATNDRTGVRTLRCLAWKANIEDTCARHVPINRCNIKCCLEYRTSTTRPCLMPGLSQPCRTASTSRTSRTSRRTEGQRALTRPPPAAVSGYELYEHLTTAEKAGMYF